MNGFGGHTDKQADIGFDEAGFSGVSSLQGQWSSSCMREGRCWSETRRWKRSHNLVHRLGIDLLTDNTCPEDFSNQMFGSYSAGEQS